MSFLVFNFQNLTSSSFVKRLSQDPQVRNRSFAKCMLGLDKIDFPFLFSFYMFSLCSLYLFCYCRFQLLGEFDDGKRSCRKQLAEHNERRRKSRMSILSDGISAGRLLHSCNGICILYILSAYLLLTIRLPVFPNIYTYYILFEAWAIKLNFQISQPYSRRRKVNMTTRVSVLFDLGPSTKIIS